jgi:hypothetical protein
MLVSTVALGLDTLRCGAEQRKSGVVERNDPSGSVGME